MSPAKRSFGIGMTLSFLAGFGWLLLSAGLGAAPTQTTPGLLAPGAAVAVADLGGDPGEQLYLNWLGACGAGMDRIGIYHPGDEHCRPQDSMGVAWLQGQLVGIGLVDQTEYLEADPAGGRCPLFVYAASNHAAAGRVCLTGTGAVFRLRAAPDGEHTQSAQWQYHATGVWTRAGSQAIAAAVSEP